MGCWQHTRPYRGHIYHLSNQLNRHNLFLCHTWKHLAHSCRRFHKSFHTKTHHILKKGSGNTLLKVHFLYYILKAIFSLFLYDLFYCYCKYKKFKTVEEFYSWYYLYTFVHHCLRYESQGMYSYMTHQHSHIDLEKNTYSSWRHCIHQYLKFKQSNFNVNKRVYTCILNKDNIYLNTSI